MGRWDIYEHVWNAFIMFMIPKKRLPPLFLMYTEEVSGFLCHETPVSLLLSTKQDPELNLIKNSISLNPKALETYKLELCLCTSCPSLSWWSVSPSPGWWVLVCLAQGGKLQTLGLTGQACLGLVIWMWCSIRVSGVREDWYSGRRHTMKPGPVAVDNCDDNRQSKS